MRTIDYSRLVLRDLMLRSNFIHNAQSSSVLFIIYSASLGNYAKTWKLSHYHIDY